MSAITIRPATIDDCEHIAALGLMAGDGVPSFFWAQSLQPNETLLEAGARRAASGHHNFSWRNSELATVDDEVAGLLLAYALTDLPDENEIARAPEFIRPLLRLELEVPGSYYINMIATYPRFRRRGVGLRLMQRAEQNALARHIDQVSLQVFSENTGAIELYRACGYEERARLPVVPHECYPYTEDVVLLVKGLSAG